MKSKLTANYKQEYTKKEIHQAITTFQRSLIEKLEERLNIFEVQSPMFETVSSSSDTFQSLKSRSISFNTATDDEIYFVTNRFDYFFRNQLIELEVSNNNGIYSLLDFISRDTTTDNNSSLRKRRLHIELRYEGENVEEYEEQVVKIVNKSIYLASEQLTRVIKEFKTPYILEQKLFDFNNIKIEKGSSTELTIDDLSSKEGFALFKWMNNERVRRLFTADKSAEIISTYWSPLEKEAHSIIRAGRRANYEDIVNMAKDSKTDINDEVKFASKILNRKTKPGIYVEIDIYRALIAILELAHISELQTDQWDVETSEYVKKHNIKTLRH